MLYLCGNPNGVTIFALKVIQFLVKDFRKDFQNGHFIQGLSDLNVQTLPSCIEDFK